MTAPNWWVRRCFALCLVTILLTLHSPPLTAQVPADLQRERAEFAAWLATAPLSPYAAIAQQPVGSGITLGPAASDIPLDSVPATRVVEEGGLVVLRQGGARQVMARGRVTQLGRYRLIASGAPGRTVLGVYGGAPKTAPAPTFFPYAGAAVVTGVLEPAERKGRFRVLGPDGVETAAEEVGIVVLRVSGADARLRIYRLGDGGDDAETVVFFRDSTSAHGSYPAGRFLSTELLPGLRARLDFNRARNPFCAYSTVYACPAPWPGNTIPAAVQAGEQYVK
jgi:hypothetical protein